MSNNFKKYKDIVSVVTLTFVQRVTFAAHVHGASHSIKIIGLVARQVRAPILVRILTIQVRGTERQEDVTKLY